MAFRKKADTILRHRPDILVIPECEHPNRFKFTDSALRPVDWLWFGWNQHKGLGIFSYSEYKLKLLDNYNPDFKLIIPICVSNRKDRFTLYAIWANNPSDKEGRYITQIWKAVNFYDRLLRKKNTLLVGDFNSNTIWDKPRRKGNHSTLVDFLQQKEIYSVYHHHFKQEQGKEIHPTLFMYRQKDKPYHIDYCFASKNLIEKLQSVEVGDFTQWSTYSDHVPLVAHFSLK